MKRAAVAVIVILGITGAKQAVADGITLTNTSWADCVVDVRLDADFDGFDDDYDRS